MAEKPRDPGPWHLLHPPPFLLAVQIDSMRCLVCSEIIAEGRGWEHIRAVHLEPLGLTQEKILEHARKIAQPLEVKTAYLTCINLKENVIYFSLDNAELLIAFAKEHGNVPWMDIVEWQMLHEKGHITCQGLYGPPELIKPAVLLNAEDYYINKHLIPEKYWQACIMNARCATEIRNITPLPDDMRDTYYYCTLATFLAYEAVTFEDISFLKPQEARFVQITSGMFRRIKVVEDIPMVAQEIGEAFARLFPPPGISWDNWQILPRGGPDQ